MTDFERRRDNADYAETIDAHDVIDLQLSTEAARRLRVLSHITYGLYAAGWFTGGMSAIVGLIIDYLKRGEAGLSVYASHAGWRIRTFWWTLLWVVLAAPLTFFAIGVPLMVIIAIWYAYRLIKGWLQLWELKAVTV